MKTLVGLLCLSVAILSCDPSFLSRPQASTRVSLSFTQTTVSASRELGSRQGGGRLLAPENVSAVLLVSSDFGPEKSYDFLVTVDQDTGLSQFSLDLELVYGTYQMVVQTFDSSGRLLTLGDKTVVFDAPEATVTIKMQAPVAFSPGSFDLDSEEVRYYQIPSGPASFLQFFGTGHEFTLLDSQGGIVSSPSQDFLLVLSSLLETWTLKVANSGTAGTFTGEPVPTLSINSGSLNLDPAGERYFYLSSSSSKEVRVGGFGATFWVCQPNGSFVGQGTANQLDITLSPNNPVLVRVLQDSNYGTVYALQRYWLPVATLTTSATHPGVTSEVGWEFFGYTGGSLAFATPNNTGQTQVFFSYDISTDQVIVRNLTGNDLAAAGYNSSLVGLGTGIYYFANTGTVYDLSTDLWTPISSYGSAGAESRGETGVAVLGSKIYLYGGRDIGAGYGDDFLIWDQVNNTWSTSASHPAHATDWAALGAWNNKIYIFGGQQSPNKLTVYDPATDVFTDLNPIPYAGVNTRPQVAVVGDTIYFLSDTDVYSYFPATDTWGSPILSPMDSGFKFASDGQDLYCVAWDYDVAGYVLRKFVP